MAEKKHSKKFVELVDEARGQISELDTDSLHEHMQANPDLTLVDVREESEFAEGHVKGARHLSKGVIERDIEKTLSDPNTEIVLYCGGGYRSALAALNLERMGYRNVHSLTGGFRALKRDDRFEIVRD